MKSLKLTTVIALIAIALSGCANVGNKSIKGVSDADVALKIEEGVTTRSEVRDAFGGPMETTYTDSGMLVWKYQYDDTSALTPETVGSVVLTLGLAGTKSRGQRNELVVLFNEDDIVERFSMSNSEIEAGTLLFGN
jgi:outer membrane protein assembly factor BamE (lipoprotein component of BamABCDE complex)